MTIEELKEILEQHGMYMVSHTIWCETSDHCIANVWEYGNQEVTDIKDIITRTCISDEQEQTLKAIGLLHGINVR